MKMNSELIRIFGCLALIGGAAWTSLAGEIVSAVANRDAGGVICSITLSLAVQPPEACDLYMVYGEVAGAADSTNGWAHAERIATYSADATVTCGVPSDWGKSVQVMRFFLMEPEIMPVLDYIRSTGTQWIQTGVIPTDKTTIRIKYECNPDVCPFGLTERFYCFSNHGDYAGVYSGFQNKSGSAADYPLTNCKVDLTFGFGAYTNSVPAAPGFTAVLEDGTTYAEKLCEQSEIIDLSATTTSRMPLFRRLAYKSSEVSKTGVCRIHFAKIYEGGRLIRDFVPVKSGSIPALFDLCEGKVYRNEVTDVFTYGDQIGTMPGELIVVSASKGFTTSAADLSRQVEFISADWWKSQYIDLGIRARSGLEIESEMEWNVIPSDSGCYIGARGASSGDARFFVCGYRPQGYYIGYKTLGSMSCKATRLKKCTVNTLMLAGCQRFSIDGELKGEFAVAGGYDCGCNLYLFAANTKGENPALYSSAKCYGIKVWDYTTEGRVGERVLVRNYLPYLDEVGQPCLYEAVGGGWYHPGGANQTLEYGDIPVKGEVGHFVEYIESTGAQYIDTKMHGTLGVRTSCELSFDTIPSVCCLFGECSSGHRVYPCYYNDGSFCWAPDGFVQPNPPCPATAGERYTVETTMFSNYRCFKVNGVQYGVTGTTPISLRWDACNYCLFALNQDGAIKSWSKLKCYGIKLWVTDDGSKDTPERLIWDLRPCVDKAGRPGLYDKVRDIILYNSAGGEDFIAGPARGLMLMVR